MRAAVVQVSLSVRVLNVSDTTDLRTMLSMFGTAFGDVATYTSRQPDDAYLHRLLFA